MTYILSRGETVNLNTLASQRHTQTPVKVESTRDALKRNDVSAFHKAIKVFGIK